MNKHIFALSIFASALLFASPVLADQENSNWYVSGSAGAYLRNTQEGSTVITNHIITAPGTQHELFDAGETFNAALGYKLPNHFRIEGELGYTNYEPSKINPVSSAFANLDGRSYNLVSGGDYNRYSGTLNGFYDIPLGTSVTPYVGVGLGAEYGDDSTAVFQDASGNRFIQEGGDAMRGVSFGEIGVNFVVSNSISIIPAYRYYHYFANANRFGDETANTFKLGIRYSF